MGKASFDNRSYLPVGTRIASFYMSYISLILGIEEELSSVVKRDVMSLGDSSQL